MNTKDKKNQVSSDFSLVLNDSAADVFKSARHIVKALSCGDYTCRFIACIKHEFDRNDALDLKTPHYHLVLGFQDRYRLGTILNYIVDLFHCNENQVSIEKCTDIGAQARYLVHMDHPDKYQYKITDVVTNNEDSFNYYLAHFRVLDERDLVNLVERYPSKKELFLRLGFAQYTRYARIINDLLKY